MAGRREHAIPGVRMAGHKQVTSKNSHMFVSWPGKEHGVSADAPSFCCAGSPKDCLAFSPVHQVLRCILGKPKCLKQRVLGVRCEGPVRLDVGTVPCFSRSKPRYTHAPRSVACLQMGGQPLRVRKNAQSAEASVPSGAQRLPRASTCPWPRDSNTQKHLPVRH